MRAKSGKFPLMLRVERFSFRNSDISLRWRGSSAEDQGHMEENASGFIGYPGTLPIGGTCAAMWDKAGDCSIFVAHENLCPGMQHFLSPSLHQVR